MKKLFNTKFLFILASSITVLIGLTFGALYLFDKSDDTFIKSGYVLNPLSEKVEKYYFDKDTEYRTNLSSMVEFTDVDKIEVTILQDSFIHYLDNSLSFLKNGAILDLDSVKGTGTVALYNITNKSIINRKGNGYVIENSGNDIELNNFMGRISDNKYIVVGKVKAKIPGNETLIEGDYFEIVYIEDGIVNIENKDVKYQVAADETILYVGNLTIDLGDKKISLDETDIMSLTAITINGDENIEIIPKAPEKDEDDKDRDGDNNQNQPGNQAGNQTGDGQGNGGGTGGDGDNQGGNEPGTVNSGEKIDDIIVSLKDATVGSTSVSVVFDIMNETEEDRFMLKITNLDTGRTVDIVAEVLPDVEINANLLSPRTKYLFTVVNEKDSGKYFQKIFETNDFGISLTRAYATSSELGYKVNVDSNTDITNAKLSLYKFNETTMKNEIVKTSYYDNEDGETKYIDKVVWLKDIDTSKEVVFDGLDSNTIYTAVLDEFSVESSNFKDVYNITLTSMTLKKSPTFSDMKANKDMSTGSFKLSLGNIIDEDNAITGYTYLVYEHDNLDNTAIAPITKTNASPIEIKIGDEENQLKNDTNYFYKVVIEYFDNEKYVEYTTSDRINFVMGSDPYITVVPDDELISYNAIAATIYLTDNSCLVGIPNREKCPSENSSTVVTVKKHSVNGEVIVSSNLVDFEIVDDEIKYDLYLDGLQEGTQYSIEVSAILNGDEQEKQVEIMHTDESRRTITTKSLASFLAIYPIEDMNTSSANHVINQRIKLTASTNNTGTLSPDETARVIKKVVISLYEGSYPEGVGTQDPLIAPMVFNSGEGTNLKEMFYDDYYQITTDGTFGLDIDALKALGSDGKLSPTYTVVTRAYYDYEGTKEVKIENNLMVYTILESLLLENVEDPLLIVKEITNEQSGYMFDKLKDKGTVVGYSINAVYDRNGLLANDLTPSKINIYAYDRNHNRVKFYIKDNNNLVLVDKISESISDLTLGNYLNEIYMTYGTEYDTVDEVMSRGNDYYLGYEIEVTSNSGTALYPSNKNEDSPSDYGVYEKVSHSLKETPSLKMYIAKSTANSITYRYEITDPDKAIYREDSDSSYGMYYTINETDESKLTITSTELNKYSGDITIPNLNNNDIYNLYYKKNIKKSGDFATDVVAYLDGEDDGARLFDGYYNALDTNYNFKYQIINNPLTDNKVIIKILATDELLSRIVSYKIHFSDQKGNTLDRELWKLSACDDESNEEKRCFFVDYIDLKNANMKSDKNETNLISVSIEALYDNGLVGYDYTVGAGQEYPYMILQNNNSEDEYGKYLSFNSSKKIVAWDETINLSKGYYTYSFNNANRTSLFYKSALNSEHKDNINNITLTSMGYNSNYGILNPKMISVDTMSSDNNQFSFSSITPKVSVSEKTPLINGAVMGLTLSGVDLADLKNEGTASQPEYYLYIDTWNNIDDASNNNASLVVRPRLRVKIDNNNPAKSLEAVIDSVSTLPSSDKYYFNVYAYLYKNNNYEFTQLFDEGIRDRYETKTYSFGTKNGESLYTNREISYSVDDTVYGKRILNTKINLTNYKNAYPYNFDVMYLVCADNTCTKEEGYIFKKQITDEDVTNKIISEEDITTYDLEYNKNYYIYIYAIASVYEKDASNNYVLGTQYVNLIPARDRQFKLTALREPSFVITRKAKYENNQHFIDFTINVNDLDRTLIDGKYYVKLIDTNGDTVGTLQEYVDGNYVTIDNYETHEFDALVLNKKLRITDLSPDTKYSIVVYNDAYVNNYSEEIPKAERTYEVKKTHAVYTTDAYGVTFGHDISYVITDTSYLVLFRSGTNFDNVVNVNYSVSLDDEFNPGVIVTGNDEIGEEHKFEFNDESGYGMYVITRNDNLKNTLGKYYLITLSFDIRNPADGQITTLTSAYNPRFTDSVAYVKDMDKN